MGSPSFDLRQAELSDLCRRYGVRRLDLFGSAATGTFDPARSDIDSLVEFDEDMITEVESLLRAQRRVPRCGGR